MDFFRKMTFLKKESNLMNNYIENETGFFEITPDGELISFSSKDTPEIIVPDGVKTIDSFCFQDNTFKRDFIKYLYIPDSVTTINGMAIDCKRIKIIRCSSNIEEIGLKGINAPNAKIYIPDLKMNMRYNYREPSIVCNELQIGDFKFKNPERVPYIPFGYLNLKGDFYLMNKVTLTFIAYLDNLQELLYYLDTNIHIFRWYEDLIKICNENGLYENQLLLTSYKHKYYPETIEDTIKRKFEL